MRQSRVWHAERLLITGNSYIMLNTIVRTTNMAASHLVDRARRASSVLDLFFDKNESELPLSAPDRPEVLPDWRMTTAISVTQTRRSIIIKIVFKTSHSFRVTHMQMHNYTGSIC